MNSVFVHPHGGRSALKMVCIVCQFWLLVLKALAFYWLRKCDSKSFKLKKTLDHWGSITQSISECF